LKAEDRPNTGRRQAEDFLEKFTLVDPKSCEFMLKINIFVREIKTGTKMAEQKNSVVGDVRGKIGDYLYRQSLG
jgi:ribosomal protein S5